MQDPEIGNKLKTTDITDYAWAWNLKKTPRSGIKYVMRLQKPSSDDVDKAFTNALFTTKNNRSSSPRRQRQ
jgi:hypothetical protein